jgi:hypothetical protein
MKRLTTLINRNIILAPLPMDIVKNFYHKPINCRMSKNTKFNGSENILPKHGQGNWVLLVLKLT